MDPKTTEMRHDMLGVLSNFFLVAQQFPAIESCLQDDALQKSPEIQRAALPLRPSAQQCLISEWFSIFYSIWYYVVGHSLRPLFQCTSTALRVVNLGGLSARLCGKSPSTIHFSSNPLNNLQSPITFCSDRVCSTKSHIQALMLRSRLIEIKVPFLSTISS